MLGELRDLELAFHTAPAKKRELLAQQYYEKLAQGYALEAEFLMTATRAFAAEPNKNEDLKQLLSQISTLLVAEVTRMRCASHRCCWKTAWKIVIYIRIPLIQPSPVRNLKWLNDACRLSQNIQGISEQNSQRLRLIDVYKTEWKREQKRREAEQDAADLPRVVLVTVRGEIELELFENEAPNTVANFIALVEDGFYDGSTFHEVTSGFAARAGCPLGDGTGSPGHLIRHEFGRPDRRIHLRGSLATVSEGPVASGSQFYLTFLPIPQLEEQSTVSGASCEVWMYSQGCSVAERMPWRQWFVRIALFPRRSRKRNHTYKPDRIPYPTAEQRNKRQEFMQKMLSR